MLNYVKLPCENFSEISARFWPPRFSSRRDLGRDLATNLGAFLAAEIFISAEISARSRGRDFRAEISSEISAAKNAPRVLARSRRDENLGGQKRAEITGEISPR